MSGLNSGVAANVVKTALDKVFNTNFADEQIPGYATAQTASIFVQDTIDRAAVITEQFMGSGYWSARQEQQDVASAGNKVGNQKTFSVVNYSNSIDISKNFFDDDQHSVVQMAIKNMARNARLTRDKNAFSQYVGAFATYTTNDGINTISASHVTLGGETVSNLVTGALTDTTLENAINALIEQKTQDGTLGGHTPAVLLVPPTLFKEAQIITKSELRSGTANNDMNYYSQVYPGLQVYQNPFLGANYGGSDTAWYVLSKDHSIYRWVRQAVNTDMVDYKTQRNNNYIYKGEYREVVGALSFEGIVGSTGL
jgi:phage major head subunit gpT-like protein